MQPKNNDQLLNYKHQIQNNPHFCILPFIHLHVGTIGDVKPCCMAKWQHPIQKNVIGGNLIDIWSGEEYRTLRNKMLNGEPISAAPIVMHSIRQAVAVTEKRIRCNLMRPMKNGNSI
jgi:hypothetical protein